MMRRSAERGEGNLGCILWLLLFAIGALIAWKAVPVKVQSAELYDYMVELTKFAASSSPAQLKKQILAKAKELDLPLDPDDVEVQKTPDRIQLEASYTVPLEFPGYTYEWSFDHQVDRPIFIF
ncbi:MAG TPA: hypothetical protein VMW27_31050 [Thermoanaerobaculia bacterium]|nr:hypothetical protein [Thermoanaerobaculia bacterium]